MISHRNGRNLGPYADAYTATMTKKLLSVVTIALAASIAAFAGDATGKWTYEQAGRNGGAARPVTITLKQDGSKLTGSVPGMRGGDPTEITDGKVEGDNISFTVKREMNGMTMVTKYEGAIEGDTLKLKVTRDTPNGPMTNDVVAKKSTT